MNAALKCVNLTSGYGNVPAVHSLNLEVDKGEIVALLGPNGAGKTTTLLTVAGVIKPISGTVEVFGVAGRPRRPHLAARRGVSLVPAGRSLFFELTTRENIKLALSRQPRSARSIDTVLDLFPALARKVDVRVGLLSGGEQQMLAIGQAIAGQAQLLMIDEMSLGLAPIIAKRILPIVRRAARESGVSVLIVEQHIDLALDIADRAYVLRQGIVTMSGLAKDLRGQRELIQASYLGAAVEDMQP